MNEEQATVLLQNLVERARESEEKTFITKKEVVAIESLLGRTFGVTSSSQIESASPATQQVSSAKGSTARLSDLALSKEELVAHAYLCIDFGTSFSKAFATININQERPDLIDLDIGDGSTGSKLTTPSEMLIDEGNIHFGSFARRRLEDSEIPSDRLIDSIKHYITLNSDVSMLGAVRLDVSQDPLQLFSKRDILILYLAHLQYLTEQALVRRGLSPNVARRFAHPAWKDETKAKNEKEMRNLMAEALLLSRVDGHYFEQSISIADARSLLDQLASIEPGDLPHHLIDEPVREATAAGAGALLATPEHDRQSYVIVDVGAGTTDVAGFVCVNNPDWERARLFEITGAADAKNMAGNALDNALQKFMLQKSSAAEGTEEYRAVSMFIRRRKRLYKEQLFAAGSVIVSLPTDETISVSIEEFLSYQPVVSFASNLTEMVAKSASIVAGNASVVNLVATGGGSGLPVIKQIEQNGVTYNGKFIRFNVRDLIAEGVRETNPDLVDVYPQIAVSLGGSLPNLPEQKSNISVGLIDTPKTSLSSIYK